jgi:hypothetical protein
VSAGLATAHLVACTGCLLAKESLAVGVPPAGVPSFVAVTPDPSGPVSVQVQTGIRPVTSSPHHGGGPNAGGARRRA